MQWRMKKLSQKLFLHDMINELHLKHISKKIIRPTHQSFDNGIIILNGLPVGYLLPYRLI